MSVDLYSAMARGGVAQDALMFGQHRRVAVAQPLQQERRTLDVGEQQGDDPTGQFGHTHSLGTTSQFVE
jgi:hypothetical protein